MTKVSSSSVSRDFICMYCGGDLDDSSAGITRALGFFQNRKVALAAQYPNFDENISLRIDRN